MKALARLLRFLRGRGRRLPAAPAKLTLDTLLTADDVAGALAQVAADQHNITRLLVMWVIDEETPQVASAGCTPLEVIGLAEIAKLMVVQYGEGDDEGGDDGEDGE
jgi:hypothetical protein